MSSTASLGAIASSTVSSSTAAITQTVQAAPMLTVTATGFSINAAGGQVQTTGTPFYLWGFAAVAPQLVDGSLIYTVPGWIAKVTPTEDSSGIHFAMQFTNTGTSTLTVPDFTLCGLTGNLQTEWANNQTAPFVLDQTLADGTHCALTVDDINYPMVAQFLNATNPANGTENIYFHPTGAAYNSHYDLGLVPVTVAPGGSTTIHCSLRFGATTASVSAATDAAWAQHFPYALNWTDRRQMLRGSMFGATLTAADPQGCLCGFDINNPANFQAFNSYAMTYAANAIATCKACNAGTWIEWELEGKEQGFDYKGSPQLIEALNPGWAYTDGTGVPLITRFFQAFQKAGINVGVCIRPWTLAINSNGQLYQDTSISGVQSVANQIDYCEKTWGIKVFYVDSPEQQQTAAYRDVVLSRPGTLLIPEDVPESWLQFCAPMVWLSGDNINWITVPRSIYGAQAWGVYFHQDLTVPTNATNFLADAESGSAVLTDGGWVGVSNNPQIQAAMALYTKAAAAKPQTPLISVTDAGGTYDDQPFVAAATATIYGIDLPTPDLTYYSGLTATGTPLSAAPENPGTYTVLASVAGNFEYLDATAQATFTIASALPAVTAPVAPDTTTSHPGLVKKGMQSFSGWHDTAATGVARASIYYTTVALFLKSSDESRLRWHHNAAA